MVKLPEARITHIISGRLRIKIPSKKGNTSYFKFLERKFSDFDKVQKVEANAVTAGMLLLHDTDIKNISRFAEENRLFVVENRRPEQMVLTKRIKSGLEDLNKRATRFTGGELDLAGAVFVSLLSISIYQIARGNFFAPAWYTSLWYAVNMVFKSSDNN